MAITYAEKKARRLERVAARETHATQQSEYGGEERYRIICDLKTHLFQAQQLLFRLRCETDKGPIPPSLHDRARSVALLLSHLED